MEITLRQDIAKAFEDIKSNKELDNYKDLSKQIADTELLFTNIYELLREKVGSELTKEEAYALFIVDVRNALTCLKRVETTLTKSIE